MINRIPPSNVDAERAVLGAMMTKRDVIPEVNQIIKADDFYRKDNRLMYETLLELVNAGEPTDLITVTEALRKAKRLDDVGGVMFVTALANNTVVTAANVLTHAKMVRETAQLRRLIDVAAEVTDLAYENTEDVTGIMDKAEQLILSVASSGASNGFVPMREIVMGVIEKLEKLSAAGGGITGLPSGFKDLDRMTAGFQKSDLILVAARPSMGKTAFTLNIAAYMIRHGKTVAFFSLEMAKDQLALRMMSSEGEIDSQRLSTGQITEKKEWEKFMKICSSLSMRPIYIDDTPGITVMELRTKARRLKAEKGLDIIIIDYLQLMQGRGSSVGDNRQQEISEISRSLKALARELDVPVIALSQLSRGVESRQIKRPMLSDLRESGSLEQDADLVMFLYREEYYDQDTENKNKTEVIIAKHRNGPIGTVELFFEKQFTKFRNMATDRVGVEPT